ncbi:alpha/beta hydrolase [Microlunatus elymi]|uniref:Alpha/beta hydrolase n=1 Tax=Microlunatus elymi TaxID=2596828 RepID=A0A516PYU0_9ACTN|nr:alpha/beta hydrolase [Microlunatus elymi]QDP96141.1 alpha/beta hydrolase [Microlunatus elymi]
MASSENLTWQLDDITMRGTVVRPEGDGPFPAVVMVAGSGPTDRDWCSPLLPGSNGSGKLFAEVLAEAGIASIRYDKRATGPLEDIQRLVGTFSMQSHLDELIAAVGVLAARDFIDPNRIAGLGNSEGTLHLLHYATSDQPIGLIGLVLLAPPGRAVGEVVISQLARQAANVPGGEALMPMVRAAAERYTAGQPMDPDPSLPDSVKQLLASFETPANLPLARELWDEDATLSLPQVAVPMLIMIGRKDQQVDVEADGQPLQAAARDMDNVRFEFPADANHVFKQDTRSLAEIAAAPAEHYNQPGGRLDPDSVRMIVDWLQSLFG